MRWSRPPVALTTLIALATLAAGCDRQSDDLPVASPMGHPDEYRDRDRGQPEIGEAPIERGVMAHLDPGAGDPEPVRRAVAVLHPTRDSEVKGVIRFEERRGGLLIRADVTGLPPGEHAYRVHLLGDCSDPAARSAGAGFNLEGSSRNPPVAIARVTGKLGELDGGADGGRARQVKERAGVSLHGRYSILGRSVIVHEEGDDATDASGPRLACGVIGVDET